MVSFWSKTFLNNPVKMYDYFTQLFSINNSMKCVLPWKNRSFKTFRMCPKNSSRKFKLPPFYLPPKKFLESVAFQTSEVKIFKYSYLRAGIPSTDTQSHSSSTVIIRISASYKKNDIVDQYQNTGRM